MTLYRSRSALAAFAVLLPICALLTAPPACATAQESADSVAGPYTASNFRGLPLRSLGPALTSGRISEIAVNPENPAEYYVAVSSGGVWKTVNSGTTFEPIFDSQGSYSIGTVALDPTNPNVVWVGTGENNGQRSVAYGDGVYKSVDGGRNWKKVGLESSEHIGRILIDPRDPDVVLVAAQGPLWSAGGDRGVYKTSDGGATWRRVLETDEHTGASDLAMDPRDPDVLYASTWQRRRHVWTFIGGGPGSALWKSTDGGDTWTKLTSGLPSGENIGRYGVCVSPVDPDYVYAILEAEGEKGGFFRSTDRGGSFQRMGSYSTSGNYYQEILCSPHDRDRVYAMDVWGMVTDDGGRSFQRLGERHKHVDNHALWIDPERPGHYLNGNDGGVYESWDGARTWQFRTNLPVTQFYKVTVDQAAPFYNVYGGTQDNFTLGGPVRTTNAAGIVNADWIVTRGGDGFETQVDPTNPDIVYSQSQYGVLYRYDRRSGEEVFIQPQPGQGDPGLRWNWDAPLLISPHSPTRLYFAANRVFRSDDRGDSWTAVSDDLSRQLDRNTLPVMGRVWGMDAVAKNTSTSIYGNVVALAESPLAEGLLYAGTDDGLIQVTEDGGNAWRRVERFPGVPERTYVNMVVASLHDRNTVYGVFNNHKNGDFAPYLLKSTDAGRSWRSIAGDLPARGSVYAVAEDHEDPALLFAGTEFGLFFTRDGGDRWIRLQGGLPTIAVRDLEIQRRENDLVLATFGRGFYVLDDYTPLRHATREALAADAHLFPVKDALLYVEARPLGLAGKSFQGESYYAAENPPFGAVFTLHLKEKLETRKERREEEEKRLADDGRPVPYPSFEEMRAEDDEEDPYLLLTITDASGEVVRRIRTEPRAGIQRVAWDLRYPPVTPVDLGPAGPENPFFDPPTGPLVAPGAYQVSLSSVVDGVPAALAGPVSFEVVPLNNATLAAEDKAALLAFQQDAGELRRELRAAGQRLSEAGDRLRHLREAVLLAPRAPESALGEVRSLQARLDDLRRRLGGDFSVSRRQFETPPSMVQRLERTVGSSYNASSAPSASQREQVRIAREEFGALSGELSGLLRDLESFEARMEEWGAPYTPGRRAGS